MHSSAIGPGPLGICETRPKAEAPHSIAIAASSTLAMQQIFTLGWRIGCILVAGRCSLVAVSGRYSPVIGYGFGKGPGPESNDETELFAVRHPDILHLRSMLQVPAAFPLCAVEPVNRAAFVGKYLFEVAGGI